MKRYMFAMLIGLLLTLPALTVAQESDDPNNWWNDRVWYEIFVRSFYDSDGDGIGDIQGIISQLDYLNDGDPTTTDDLGITGIWLMPINPSPTYHGYDVTDYRDINPEYGTMEDFRQLLDEAEARGIAIIMDLVLNHTADDHPWFQAALAGDPEFVDWYVFEEDDPGFRGPENQQVWYETPADAALDAHYYALFWSEMPDLNYTNPDVTAEAYDIARFWLEDVGVDGFRLDAIKYLVEEGAIVENSGETLAWFVDFQNYIKSINPDALLIGEVWSNTAVASVYVPEQVDMIFEFELARGLLRSASFGTTSSTLNALELVLESYPQNQYATFLSNHDQDRVMSVLRGDVGDAKAAAVILLTLPGVPFLYYGEEIGMVGDSEDPERRTPMQWSDAANGGFTTGEPWADLKDDFETVNVAAQFDDETSLLSTYRDLIHVRNASPAVQRGTYALVESTERRVIASIREYEGEIVLVLANIDDEPVTDYALTLAASGLTEVTAPELLLGIGEITLPDLNAEGGFADYTPVPELPAQSATIIRLSQ